QVRPLPGQVSVRTHRSRGQVVVAMCDADLVGRRLEEGELTVTLSEGFYAGETFDAEETGLFNLLRGANSYNIFGEAAIQVALRYNLLDRSAVRMVGGVPHAQVYCL
ncbi:MAG TPA: DUF424 family protein, partial [Candidatus Thermoplasmatota archaeon]